MPGKLAQYPKTIAFALGCLSVAALPPYYLLPFLIISFSGLLIMLGRNSSAKKSFLLGYWFGFGHYACGFFWITNALMLDLPRLGWLIPLVFVGSGGFFGLFTAFPALFCCRFKTFWAKLLAFAAAWTVFEWLRSFVLTGFPWNLLGTVWSFSNAAIQAASCFGTYGLSLLTIFAAAAPGLLFFSRNRKAAVLAVSIPVLISGFLFGYGTWRLSHYPDDRFSEIKVRIVQPAIPQQMKWQPEMLEQNLQTYVNMSRPVANDSERPFNPDLVIWGETATPFVLRLEPQYLEMLLPAVPPQGFLITGILDYDYDGEKWRPLNAMQAFDRRGIFASYAKSHLVPFGEYIPLRRYLPDRLKPVTNVIADFMPGNGVETIRLPGIPPFGVLICYEIIFPAEVADNADRPQWLINLTNDGWYGDSAGPRQHLVATRMRAVEEGLTIVRAANSGISALISKTGTVLRQLPLNVSGTLDVYLPHSLSIDTWYKKYHNFPVLFICLLCIVLAVALNRKHS